MKLLDNSNYLLNIKQLLDKSDFDFNVFSGKNILVTGGLGLIGSAVVDILLKLDDFKHVVCSVFIADLNKDGFDKKYNGFKNVNFIQYNALENFDFKEHYDFIINCAGIANPNLYVSKPVETTLSSLNGILNILKYANDNKDVRIVTTSSSEVYGVKADCNPFIENKYGLIDFDNIRSSYAVGKIVTESLCRSYASEYGLNVCFVRPGHIFGPSASRNDTRVSSAFCYLAVEKKPLELYGDGCQRRSYLYSLDCALAILTVLVKGKSGESYNIGHIEETTVRVLCEYISDFAKVPLKIGSKSNTKETSNPMDFCTLDSRKLFSLGFKPAFSVREAIEQTITILQDLENN